MVTPETLKAFGIEVRAARVAAGWTLAKLAREAFGNEDRKGYASSIENGRNQITPLTVGELAEALDLPDSVTRPMMDNNDTPKDEMSAQFAVERELVSRADPLREEGITEKAIIRLAQRIAADTEDVGQAWLELQNAMDVAVRVQADGRVTSNHGDFVDEVLKRVAELSAEGEYGSAGDAIDAALAREEEETKARQGKLFDRGVEVALLDRDTKRAAKLLVRKADLEAGGVAGFEDLRAVRNFYYERGRDRGINLDLELAIDLAELVKARADGWSEVGTALNDLGIALGTLGERESGTGQLEEAVKAFEAALEEWTRDLVPLQWAMTQMNLGNALLNLGRREAGTVQLDEAVTAYKAALEERTRDKVPLDWAMTQTNLGNALLTLGQRHTGTARLDEAVTAYTAALEERTRDKVPLQWATTQMNLGNALLTLGKRETGTARLDEAVTVHKAALVEWTRDKAPLQWAMTQGNLANVEIAFFDKTGDADHLDRAGAYVGAAQEVFLDAGADHYIGMTDKLIGMIETRREK